MKKWNLDPTKETIIDSLKSDFVGRNQEVYNLVKLCECQEDACAIAIDGAWGSGKTFFVKQVQALMLARNSLSCELSDDEKREIREAFDNVEQDGLDESICVFYYDAWENDSDNDPLLSLVYSIAVDSHQLYKFKNKIDILNVAASIIELVKEKDYNKVINSFKKGSVLDEVRDGKNLHSLIDKFLNELNIEKGNRLVIIVDELDRCRPDFAVQLLEKIKHYMSHKQVIFIFAINAEQLGNTIKRYYGTDFDATRYLDKFFDFRLTLSKADVSKLYYQLGLEGSIQYVFEKVCKRVIDYFHFELREIIDFYKRAKIAVGTKAHSNNSHEVEFFTSDSNGRAFGFIVIVPLLIGLHMSDSEQYRRFIQGDNPDIIIGFLDNGKVAENYCRLLLSKNETFGDVDSDNKLVHVNFNDRIKQFYETLFLSSNSEENYEKTIGQIEVNGHLRTEIIEAAGMLSVYSNYNI